MWAYLIAVALIFIGIIVGLAGGGIFTIVLIPIGLIVLVAAFVFGAGGRKAQKDAGGSAQASHVSDRPLPTHGPRDTGRAPTSPEALADARRVEQ